MPLKPSWHIIENMSDAKNLHECQLKEQMMLLVSEYSVTGSYT